MAMNQAKENGRLQTHIHLLVSLMFATHRATCKAIKTAADSFIRIRDFKGACIVTYVNACFILEIEK